MYECRFTSKLTSRFTTVGVTSTGFTAAKASTRASGELPLESIMPLVCTCTKSAAGCYKMLPRALRALPEASRRRRVHWIMPFRRPSRPSEDLRDFQKIIATSRTPPLTPETPPHAPNAVACIGSCRVRREPRHKRRGRRLNMKIAALKIQHCRKKKKYFSLEHLKKRSSMKQL